jgi:hypothetical protein
MESDSNDKRKDYPTMYINAWIRRVDELNPGTNELDASRLPIG